MPTYTFMNSESGMEYDETMLISEYDEYMKNNPKVERVYQPVAIAGDHVMGVGPKNDAEFTEKMQRVAAAHHNSAVADKYGSGNTKAQFKAQSVVDKHKRE